MARVEIGTVLDQSYDNVDRSAYTTASVTPTAGRLVLLCIKTTAATASAPSSITGTGWASGLSWTQIDTKSQGASLNETCYWAVCPASPAGGTVTINITNGTGCAWYLFDLTGADTSAPIVQHKVGGGAAASGSISLNSAVDTNNACIGMFSHAANETEAVGAHYTLVGAVQAGTAPVQSSATEFVDTAQTVVDMSWTTSANWAGIAFEVQALHTGTGAGVGAATGAPNVGGAGETDGIATASATGSPAGTSSGATVASATAAPRIIGPASAAAAVTRASAVATKAASNRAAVVMYGAAGSFGGHLGDTVTPGGTTFQAIEVAGFTFPAGKQIGPAAPLVGSDGLVLMAGMSQTTNAAQPTGRRTTFHSFDPQTQQLSVNAVQSTTGFTDVIGPNGQGGAFGADAEIVVIGGVEYAFFLNSFSYPFLNGADWDISTYGYVPAIIGAKKVAGVWTLDAAHTWTTQQLQASSAAGAAAFPDNVNADFGQTFPDDRALGELCITPASKVILSQQYFPNPNFPGTQGGVVAIDADTGVVLAYYAFPFTPISPITSLNPRTIQCDPTGIAGNEVFAVPFDVFGGNENFVMFLTYDSIGHTITPLSAWLRDPFLVQSIDGAVPVSGKYAGSCYFDQVGNVWFTRNEDRGAGFVGGLDSFTAKRIGVWLKEKGTWTFARAPYAYSGPASAGVACPFDAQASIPTTGDGHGRSSTGYAQNLYFDPVTSCLFWADSARAIGRMKLMPPGSTLPGASRLIPLPPVNTNSGNFPHNGLTANLFMGADPVARKIYVPFGQRETGAYPPTPPGQVQTQWLVQGDMDLLGRTPATWQSSEDAHFAVGSFTPPLPTFDVGVLVLMFMVVAPGTVIGGLGDWNLLVDVADPAVSPHRWTLWSRQMLLTDVAPTITVTPNTRVTWEAISILGVHPYNPTPAIGVQVGQAGAPSSLIRPSVHVPWDGCVPYGFTGQDANATFAPSDYEITRNHVNLVGNLGMVLTEDIDSYPRGATTPPRTVIGTPGLGGAWGYCTITVLVAPAAQIGFSVAGGNRR